MHRSYNINSKKWNIRRNRIAQSWKHQKIHRERKLQMYENIIKVNCQTNGLEGRSKKIITLKVKTWNQFWSRKLIKWINTWIVSFVRYSGSLLIESKEELINRNNRSWKLISMLKIIQRRDSIYERKKQNRGWASIEHCVDVDTQWFREHVRRKSLIRAASKSIKNKTTKKIKKI